MEEEVSDFRELKKVILDVVDKKLSLTRIDADNWSDQLDKLLRPWSSYKCKTDMLKLSITVCTVGSSSRC